jgi:hypothetical protein
MLAVIPEYRRLGIVGLLVEWGTNLADENCKNAYIDATEMGCQSMLVMGFLHYLLQVFRESYPSVPLMLGSQSERLLENAFHFYLKIRYVLVTLSMFLVTLHRKS